MTSKTQNTDKKKRIQRLQNEIDTLNRTQNRLQKQIRQLEDEISTVTDYLHTQKDKLTKLNKKRKTIQQNINEKSEKIRNLNIDCGFRCPYADDLTKCPKKDKSKCVYAGNKTLDAFIAK